MKRKTLKKRAFLSLAVAATYIFISKAKTEIQESWYLNPYDSQ